MENIIWIRNAVNESLNDQFEKAKSLIKKNTKNVIKIEEGSYYIVKPVFLDSSFDDVDIIADGKVSITGGICINSDQFVSDFMNKELLDADVQSDILCCDLSAFDTIELQTLRRRGFGMSAIVSHSEAFEDGVSMNLSRYPKEGEFLKIKGYGKEIITDLGDNAHVGALSEGFYYQDERPQNWTTSNDVWVHGYWAWDWAETYEKIDIWNKESCFIKTYEPYGAYEYRKDQRFYFLNILEEIKSPGDFYIDIQNKKLYIYPYNPDFKEITVSTLSKELLLIDNVKNMKIEGIIFDVGCSNGLVVINSENITVDNCEAMHLGNNGLVMCGCINSCIKNCTVHDTGDGGIHIFCGDRVTLEPADILVYNNYIYNIAKWSRCYKGAINLFGVGTHCKNNLIHDCPHNAILYCGNEIILEKNEIYSAVMETGDAGALYIGRDFTYRGNKVIQNFIHNLGGVGFGTMAIYNDDCVSGTEIRDNIIFNVFRAITIGGGRDFTVNNNLLINCEHGIDYDSRGTSNSKGWLDLVNVSMRHSYYHISNDMGWSLGYHITKLSRGEISGNSDVYLSKYPDLKIIDYYYSNNLHIPAKLSVENNLFSNTKPYCEGFEYETGEYCFSKNKSCERNCFADADNYNFQIDSNSSVLEYGYSNIDTLSIGIRENERRNNPYHVILSAKYENGKIHIIANNLQNCSANGFISIKESNHSYKDFEVNIEPLNKCEILFDSFIDPDRIYEINSKTLGFRPCQLIPKNT